jgi:site-specific recombinase XerD
MLAKTWLKALLADNKSPNTIRIYLHAVRLLGEWAFQQDESTDPSTITRDDIRDYMAALIARTSAANAHNHYRSLRTFFGFLIDEEEIDRSPMDRTKVDDSG